MHLSKRNIISIDVESNGLYGQPFCVGAVEMDWGGRVLREFLARCPLDEVEDEWVLKNVMPAIEGVEETHDSLIGMESAFLDWLGFKILQHYPSKTKEPAIVMVDVGFPVDCGFLYNAFRRRDRSDPNHFDFLKKYSPYPLFDLSSVLAGAGVDPDVDRNKYAKPLRGYRDSDSSEGRSHDPLWDAETSALCLVRAIRNIEK